MHNPAINGGVNYGYIHYSTQCTWCLAPTVGSASHTDKEGQRATEREREGWRKGEGERTTHTHTHTHTHTQRERERERETERHTGPDFAKLPGTESIDELETVTRNFQVFERNQLGLLGTRRYQATAQTVAVLCQHTELQDLVRLY